MSSSLSSEAALKLEIARLTATINSAKAGAPTSSHTGYRPQNSYSTGKFTFGRINNTYVNPNYKPSTRSSVKVVKPLPPARPNPPTADKKDVVIGGVAFESSGRSLVRKDLPKTSTSALPKAFPKTNAHLSQSRSHPLSSVHRSHRPYKPRSSARPRARNMTLGNGQSYQSRKVAQRRKFSDKPCPRFTTTGTCNRGLTCSYEHNPNKIAICWKFLQGNCPNSAETCNLSHDPTPERTPLCVHFANNGRCTRDNCPYPHVRVGVRHGICRDFAVLGYCEKGLDCDKQHIRECPDFAEKGECLTRGCRLPHVIRANRNRQAIISTESTLTIPTTVGSTDSITGSPPPDLPPPRLLAEDAKLGDEYISLTFHESEESEDESEEDDGNEDDEEDSSTVDDDDRLVNLETADLA